MSNDMFHSGDLQSGIALAIQESKFVVCFVKGTNDESIAWKDEFLQDESIRMELKAKALVFCIHTDSQEYEHLAVFYSIPTLPCIVVFHNGQLCLELSAGVSKAQFLDSLLSALGSKQNDPFVTVPSPTSLPDVANIDSRPANAEPLLAHTTTPTHDPEVQSVFEERRKRIEVERKRKAETERAKRRSKTEANLLQAENATLDSARVKQLSYAQQQRRRQQEARQERERILKVIENDKLERKYKEELHRELIKAESGAGDGADGLVDQELSAEANHLRPSSAKECAIQIRLLNGSTLRSKFPSDQTLRTHVRDWISQQRSDGDHPYSFKQILAPRPNRPIAMTEEEESLESLALTPSATLVMVPVQNFTAAYDSDSGLFSKALSSGYSLLTASYAIASGGLKSLLGSGHDLPASPQAQVKDSRSGLEVRTLTDESRQTDEQQFYNGNQLNFEPRKAQDREKEEEI